jgi:hypothetical protein
MLGKIGRRLLNEKHTHAFVLNVEKALGYLAGQFYFRLYLLYKPRRKARGVVYTCVTGGYDHVPNHYYIDMNWDYIYYTDDADLLRGKPHVKCWEIRPLVFSELDNVRNSRWHKINPHLVFKHDEYDVCLWVDGNITIKSREFFKQIASCSDALLASAVHPTRSCLYDELSACIDEKKDDIDLMKQQIKLIRAEGMPEHMGLYESNVLYRHHKESTVISAMDEWWHWVSHYSRRDQLSLTYACWRHQIPMHYINERSYRFYNRAVKLSDH